MLIYFHSGNFLALGVTFFSKGHANFFRENAADNLSEPVNQFYIV